MLCNCITSGQYLFTCYMCHNLTFYHFHIHLERLPNDSVHTERLYCPLSIQDSSVSDEGVKVHSYTQCQSYLTFPCVHSRSKLAFISKYVELFDNFVREKHLFSPKNDLVESQLQPHPYRGDICCSQLCCSFASSPLLG